MTAFLFHFLMLFIPICGAMLYGVATAMVTAKLWKSGEKHSVKTKKTACGFFHLPGNG